MTKLKSVRLPNARCIKLTDEDARLCRLRFEMFKDPIDRLAEDFGVNETLIRAALRGSGAYPRQGLRFKHWPTAKGYKTVRRADATHTTRRRTLTKAKALVALRLASGRARYWQRQYYELSRLVGTSKAGGAARLRGPPSPRVGRAAPDARVGAERDSTSAPLLGGRHG